jgi:pyruvate,water dikinase
MRAPRAGYVRPITAADELPPAAGGKALGLRTIVRAGLHVPPAWAVLPGATSEALAALAAALTDRGVSALAVRSSALDEDGARASFAGVHETALGVSPDRLPEAVAAVGASALSARALAYRRQLGLPPPRGACAVVVQELVDADAAGVAFGRGPDEVVVEAVEGLGETAVSGEASPERLVLRRASPGWTVVRREARHQPFALRPSAAGPVRVALPRAQQRSPVLAAATGAEIAGGLHVLEAAAAGALEVEWAVSDGRVAFLQARPLTRPLPAPLPPGQTWTRANIRETTPELPCAFSRAYLAPALDRAIRIHGRAMGDPVEASVPYVTTVHGRLVINERTFLDHCDALGLGEPFRAWVRSMAGGTGGTNEIPALELSAVLLRHPVRVVRSVLQAARAERNARRHLARLAARRRARRRGAAEDDAALLARVRANSVLSDVDGWIVAQLLLATAVTSDHVAATPILGGLNAAALIPRLLDGATPSISTQQVDDLVALALAFRGWPGAAAFVGASPADAEGWRAGLPAELWQAAERWIEAYGHRGPFESDLSSPRYREDRRLLAAALEPLVVAAAPAEDAEARRRRRAREREAAWAEVAAAVPRLQRARLRAILRRLARTLALREQFRSEIMVEHAGLRDDLRELGRRWAAAGRLEAADDVFHLDLEELARAAADRAYDVAAAVRRELARRAAWRRVELPNRFTSEELDGLAARSLGCAPEGKVLAGTAVSPGLAEAPVCVLRAPEEGARMPTGAVLVAPATDPGWTPLFPRASAVVVELGGLFSHAATVAREYGLPAVSNVEAATDRLHDGDVVRVDGARGLVEVVSRA